MYYHELEREEFIFVPKQYDKQLKSPFSQDDIDVFIESLSNSLSINCGLTTKEVIMLTNKIKKINSFEYISINFEMKIIVPQSFKSIGEVFKQQQNLKELRLTFECYNGIEETDFTLLVKWIKQLTNLNRLTIFTGYQNNIGIKGITALGQALKPLQNLTYLDINISEGSFIGAKGIIQFSDGIGQLNNLQVLSLNFYNNVILSQNGSISLGQNLSKLDKLTKLKIFIGCFNQVQNEGAAGIGEGIKSLQNLKICSIDFRFENNIYQEGAHVICKGLMNLSQVVELNLFLTQHFFSEEGSILFNQNANCFQQLEKLTLSIYTEDTHVPINTLKLENLYWNLPNLKSLKINVEKMNCLCNLSSGFQKLKNLEYLEIKIKSTNYGEENMKQLMENFKCLDQLVNLRMLIYPGNDLEQIAGQDLADGLKNLIKLNKLEVYIGDSKQISSTGGVLFGESLKSLQHLKDLSLTIEKNSTITLNVFQRLASGLGSLTNLEHLNLRLEERLFETQGSFEALLSKLDSLILLRNLKLNFKYYVVEKKGFSQLNKIVQQKNHLEHLWIDLDLQEINDQDLQTFIDTVTSLENLITLYHPIKVRRKGFLILKNNLIRNCLKLVQFNQPIY